MVMYADSTLRRFVSESNAIEGIHRLPTDEEVKVLAEFLAQPTIVISDLERLVSVFAPGHLLRDRAGLNVRVGSYFAPPGGLEVVRMLTDLLHNIQYTRATDPYLAHVAYENIHPFTDGNGRSGRALWAWHMHYRGLLPFSLSFLHRFYYQTLEHSEARDAQ